MKSKGKLFIGIWWSVQLCGMLILERQHLGSVLVTMLLLVSLVGYMFGGRKVAKMSSYGLAMYAILTFLLGVVFCVLGLLMGMWLKALFLFVVVLLNFVIAFRTVVFDKSC